MSEIRVKCALLGARVVAGVDAGGGSDDPIARIVETSELEQQFGGRVMEKDEGGVIYRFASPDMAVAAGLNLLSRGKSFAVLSGGETHLRVGVIYGEFADVNGNVAPEALRQVRDMIEATAAGQLTLTQPALEALPPELREMATPREEHHGVEPSLHALSVIADPRTAAALIAGPEDLLHLEPLRLIMSYQGDEWEVTAAWPVLLLGRSPNADITIDDAVVSRTHARIEYRLGRFVLIDHSRNGTFVRRPGGREVYLRQQELSLSGHGTIGLGLPASSPGDRTIEFTVTRRAAIQE